jgi:acetoin utilization deacetylase AcuC-like enzyme
MKNLGLVFFPAFDWMISPTHPERQERLLYTRDQLLEEGIFDLPEIREYRPKLATMQDLERVHVGIPKLSKLITKAHLVSAGSCLTVADAIMAKEVKRAFALVRPPGHHAMRIVHGIRGFCVVNIEAVLVSYLRRKYGVKKIAIVDTDVHHGDGSQDIFYHDENTLYISFHQDGRTLYPGSGFTDELGGPKAFGTTINIPLLPGSGDIELQRVFDRIVKPILDDFGAEITINSAGQDNHFSDPLASMKVTAQGYATLADKLKADIAVLEGGYSVEAALPYVNTGIVLAMAGLDYSGVVEPVSNIPRGGSSECMRRVDSLTEEIGNMWANREKNRAKLLDKYGKMFTRKKAIYYDEDGIMDHQIETIYYCDNCDGFIVTYSEANGPNFKNRESFIVSLAPEICEKCKLKAYQMAYDARKNANYKYICVQNRKTGLIEEI